MATIHNIEFSPLLADIAWFYHWLPHYWATHVSSCQSLPAIILIGQLIFFITLATHCLLYIDSCFSLMSLIFSSLLLLRQRHISHAIITYITIIITISLITTHWLHYLPLIVIDIDSCHIELHSWYAFHYTWLHLHSRCHYADDYCHCIDWCQPEGYWLRYYAVSFRHIVIDIDADTHSTFSHYCRYLRCQLLMSLHNIDTCWYVIDSHCHCNTPHCYWYCHTLRWLAFTLAIIILAFQIFAAIFIDISAIRHWYYSWCHYCCHYYITITTHIDIFTLFFDTRLRHTDYFRHCHCLLLRHWLLFLLFRPLVITLMLLPGWATDDATAVLITTFSPIRLFSHWCHMIATY